MGFRGKVTEEFRKLHNELLYGLYPNYYCYYYLGVQIKDSEIGWACGTYADDRRI